MGEFNNMNKQGTHLILDCTLRDGGYVNNWEFDTQSAIRVMDGLYEAGIRIIELGIMGKGGEPGKSTKFSDFTQVEPLLAHRKQDCCYAIMVNQSDIEAYEIPHHGENTVDLLRLAFFKVEQQKALQTAQELKAKGYKVFLQAMATFMYNEQELKELIAQINQTKPDGFYIVDSFSTMYNWDVRAMTDMVLSVLDKETQFGFHAHNNIQMAYSNVIEFFSTQTDRPLIADGSVFGMGRGAGNVPTELLMEYLNKSEGANYGVMKVLEVFQEVIQPIFKQYYWGYSPEYYLTARKNTNSVYSWYLRNQGVTDLRDFNAILDRIPAEIRYTLSRDVADTAMKRYFEEKQA